MGAGLCLSEGPSGSQTASKQSTSAELQSVYNRYSEIWESKSSSNSDVASSRRKLESNRGKENYSSKPVYPLEISLSSSLSP
jgi:hypothetical protein